MTHDEFQMPVPVVLTLPNATTTVAEDDKISVYSVGDGDDAGYGIAIRKS